MAISGPPLGAMTIPLPADYAAVCADTRRDTPAIIFGDTRTSYAELHRLSLAAVTWLREQGVAAGDRIAWFGRNVDIFYPVLFAAMRTGAVIVPINWRSTAAEARGVLEDAGPRLVIVEETFAPVIREASEGLAAATVVIDADGALLRAALAAMSVASETPRDPDAICLQLYTSGTTGKPKGVMLSERMIGIGRQMEYESPDFANWGDDEVLLSSMPHFHIAGVAWMLCGMLRGATCVLTADPSPGSILSLCLAHDVTRTYMVPAVLRTVLAELTARRLRIATLRGIHYGAAVIDVPLLEQAMAEFGCGFLQYYGMTEISGGCTILGPADHDPARPALLHSVGHVMPGCTIEIRDPALAPCPSGVPGEIWVRCPAMMAGYAGLPDATAEAIIDGWYRSGDGGYLDEAGYLFLTDRIKDMVISGGENVYPAEVEAVLMADASVRDVAVIGVPDERWGEIVVAVIEAAPGADADHSAIIAAARRSLAGFKTPKRIIEIDALPRTASGKVQRAELRRRFATEKP